MFRAICGPRASDGCQRYCIDGVRGRTYQTLAGVTTSLFVFAILWEWVLVYNQGIFLEHYLPLRRYPSAVALAIALHNPPLCFWQSRALMLVGGVLFVVGCGLQCVQITEYLDNSLLNNGHRMYRDIFEGDFVLTALFNRGLQNPDLNSFQVRFTEGQFNKRLTTNDKVLRHMTHGVSNDVLARTIGVYNIQFALSIVECLLLGLCGLMALTTSWASIRVEQVVRTDCAKKRGDTLLLQGVSLVIVLLVGVLGSLYQMWAYVMGYPIPGADYLGRHVFLLLGTGVFLVPPCGRRLPPVVVFAVVCLVVSWFVNWSILIEDQDFLTRVRVQSCPAKAAEQDCLQNVNVPINGESMDTGYHTLYPPVQGISYLQSGYDRVFQLYDTNHSVITWVWELHESHAVSSSGLHQETSGESADIFGKPDQGFTPVLKPRFKSPTDPESTAQYYSQWEVERASTYPEEYDRAFRATSPVFVSPAGPRFVYEHLCCGDYYTSIQAHLLRCVHAVNWWIPFLNTCLLGCVCHWLWLSRIDDNNYSTRLGADESPGLLSFSAVHRMTKRRQTNSSPE